MASTEIARAIVVDSRLLFGESLRALLANGGHEILAQAQTLDKALAQIDALNPNLVLLGPHLAEQSLDECRKITKHSSAVKVIIFTAHASEPLFQADAVYVGASACLSSEFTENELLQVIAQVLAGQRLFPQEILSLAFQPIELTERELQVLKLMAEEKTDKEIADALGLQFNTVRNHKRHILEKFNVHHREEAIWRARHLGLV